MKGIYNIGITYDLKEDYLKEGFTAEEAAEFDSIETIEGIEGALQSHGYKTERIGNVKALASRLVQGHRWDMVFNICEGVHGIGREAQVPALLDAYHIPYVFSDVLTLSLTLHKGMCKSIIRDNGIPTAGFFVLSSVEEVEKVDLPFPLFVKPVAEGTGKGISEKSRVENKQELYTQVEFLLSEFNQPVLVEEYLPGREFTAGIVGTGESSRVIGVMEVGFKSRDTKEIYSYQSKAEYEKLVNYDKVDAAVFRLCEEVALAAWKVLNCRDGGRVDLRMDENGQPNFIEVNPLAGLHPVHSDLPILARLYGMEYEEVIGAVMKSAEWRIENDEVRSV